MKIPAVFLRRLHWINFPTAALLALLQRTPVLQAVATAGEFILRAPAASLLKSVFATAASLGAVHTLAGATALNAQANPSPANTATVGSAKVIVFNVIGAMAQPGSWTVGGNVPPGMSFTALGGTTGGIQSGLIKSSSIQLSGTPTAGGGFQLAFIAWLNADGTGDRLDYTFNLSIAADPSPVFSTQPSNVSAPVGGTAVFTVAAFGTPTPTYQWQRNGATIVGQTSAILTLSNLTAGAGGSYTCVATNSLGSATSNAAILTVTGIPSLPTISTQPSSTTASVGGTATFTVVGTGATSYQWRKSSVAIAGATAATLTLNGLVAASAGDYDVVLTNAAGSVTSTVATLIVAGPSVPTISTQPAGATASLGGTATFTVVATGATSYQWRKNSAAIAGATSATLTLNGLTAADAADYDVVLTNSVGSVTSTVATLLVSAGLTSRLSNVSVRTTLAANQILTVGLTMVGGSKPVLIRAAGPSLAVFNVTGFMANPKMAVFKDQTQETANDNWGGDPTVAAAITTVAAFSFASTNSLDAALVHSFNGGRTVQVSGPTGGNVIVEAYDTVSTNSPRLTNISALNFVGTGGDVLIAGFTVSGTGSKNVLIRAGGPSLVPLGVSGVLADPKLELYTAGTPAVKIGENDNYSASLASVFASVSAFAFVPGAKDAALVVNLPAGGAGYTVTVSGADGGTGVAIVEVYELP